MKQLKKSYLIAGIITIGILLISSIAFAAPNFNILGRYVGVGVNATTTANANLTVSSSLAITGLASAGSPCLIVDSNGLVATSTCGGSSGGVSTSSPIYSGGLAYFNGSSSITSALTMLYDATTGRLTIGTSTITGLTIGSLNGILKGTTGVVGTATAGVDYESPLTFSTGLNRSVNTITNVGVVSLTATSPLSTDLATGTITISCPTCNTSSATLSGNGTSSDVSFYTGATTLGSNDGFTFNNTTGVLTVGTSTIGTSTPNGLFYIATSTPILTALNNGSIGIGVASPLATSKLHIDAGNATGRVVFDRDVNNPFILSFRTDNTPRWAFRVDTNETGSNVGSDFAVRRYNDAGAFVDSPIYIIRSSGQVGIATTTPTNALSIQGNVNITGSLELTSSTASKCARFGPGKTLVPATGDCPAGDTTGGGGGSNSPPLILDASNASFPDANYAALGRSTSTGDSFSYIEFKAASDTAMWSFSVSSGTLVFVFTQASTTITNAANVMTLSLYTATSSPTSSSSEPFVYSGVPCGVINVPYATTTQNLEVFKTIACADVTSTTPFLTHLRVEVASTSGAMDLKKIFVY